MLWLIDAGHGGLDSSGKYTTDPKIGKQFTFPDGFTIYEGLTNRAIAKFLRKKLTALDIEHNFIYDEVLDLSLELRVRKANEFAKMRKDVCVLSIHSNAGGGKGFEVFTSPGQTKSDEYAQVFCNLLKKDFPEWPFRSDITDGDLDKEEAFYILRKTSCPAILFEFLFFDVRKQANLLIDASFQQKIVDTIVTGIQQIEKGKPNKPKENKTKNGAAGFLLSND
jgi:N-acetylmuramoyl-L-alanine amidase